MSETGEGIKPSGPRDMSGEIFRGPVEGVLPIEQRQVERAVDEAIAVRTGLSVPKTEEEQRRLVAEKPIGGGAGWLFDDPRDLSSIRDEKLMRTMEGLERMYARGILNDPTERNSLLRAKYMEIEERRIAGEIDSREADECQIRISQRIEETEGKPKEEGRLKEGKIFSRRWTRLHKIQDVIPASPGMGISEPFSSSLSLSEIAESGFDQLVAQEAAIVARVSKEDGFRVAALEGMFPLLALDRVIKNGRIESISRALENGPSPEGVGRWLRADQETRRCLALMLRLQGYRVAEEPGIHDRVPILTTEETEGKAPRKFSELMPRPRQRTETDEEARGRQDKERMEISRELQAYLSAIQKEVGTDSGIVRLAYTIFRYFGFPHDNPEVQELYVKYLYNPETGQGDLEKKDVSSSLEKEKDERSGKKLAQVLGDEGVLGLAGSLIDGIKAQRIGMRWGDMKMLLDLMRAVGSIRRGEGPAATLDHNQRLEEILKLIQKDMGILDIKGSLSKEAYSRIIDPLKISTQPKRATPNVLAKEVSFLSGLISALRGFNRFSENLREDITGIPSPYRKKKEEQ